MDALPVTEQADVPYRSAVPETMHACGHDLHTSMPVGAARLLSAERARLAGSVAFMFQPGEEGFDGAGRMIDDGVLEVTGDQPAAAYALHVMSAMRPHGALRHQARPAHGGCRRHLRHGAGRGRPPAGIIDEVFGAGRRVEPAHPVMDHRTSPRYLAR